MLHASTNQRTVTDEIMDSPDVEKGAHLQALAGLKRINFISRTAHKVLPPIYELARREKLDRISLLDIACGGGDVPIGVAIGLQRRGIGVDLTLLDRSATAVQQSSTVARKAGISCQGVQADVLMALPPVRADVVTNSLFMHHLRDPEEVLLLLRRMSEMADRMVVISDLVRTRMGLVGAWVACRLLTRSKIVHHDGPASVRAAWTAEEMVQLAKRAGLTGARIVSCAPWRMLLIWEKPHGSP
jgi:2-polyprenyl-3-methyl-5-hydroxy-6-metoxy-1,4-benzoquinol methylase